MMEVVVKVEMEVMAEVMVGVDIAVKGEVIAKW